MQFAAWDERAAGAQERDAQHGQRRQAVTLPKEHQQQAGRQRQAHAEHQQGQCSPGQGVEDAQLFLLDFNGQQFDADLDDVDRGGDEPPQRRQQT